MAEYYTVYYRKFDLIENLTDQTLTDHFLAVDSFTEIIILL